MRRTISFFIILFTSFCFSQNTGSILGVVLDSELNNEPLIHANVLIKETNQITSSDTYGMFHFENLEEGNYTLVISFIGYETKEFVSLFLSKPIGEDQLGRWNNIIMWEEGDGWWNRLNADSVTHWEMPCAGYYYLLCPVVR